jgi:hypothetical protein
MDATYELNGGYQPRVKRSADLEGPDYFPTPARATYALLEKEKFVGEICEPACGDGAMTEILRLTGNPVICSDLYDRGYGEVGRDFLTCERIYDNVVTNPPYHSAMGFVEVGLKHARRKLALLLRLAFLEGGRRYRAIHARTPPSRVWVFCNRLTFYPPMVQRKGTGTIAYAWFVWDKDAPSGTTLSWIGPGTSKRSIKGTSC